MTPLLQVRGMTKRFGGLIALEDVGFELHAGEVLGVIGPNGAGKSTMFNMIAGALPADAGSVRLDAVELLGLPAHAIAARGLMRTFQHNKLFPGMTLLENVLVGAHTRMRASVGAALLGLRQAREEERAQLARALELLSFVGLADARNTEVSALSFGQGRLVEVARALAGEPRVILFDEPAAGLTPLEMARLADIIRGISARGIGVLLIDHDMSFLLPLAVRVVVLNFGHKIAEGTPQAIRRDAAVREAYLGEHVAA
jgi:ABC-type branched-subunit amino acid transport system ATPase component